MLEGIAGGLQPWWHHIGAYHDCHLYAQPGRVILHLVNLTSAGTWRQPVREFIPIGPLRVRLKLPEGVRGRHLRLLVSGRKCNANSVLCFQLRSLDSSRFAGPPAGKLSGAVLEKIENAVRRCLGL